jgi:hypothetical protein
VLKHRTPSHRSPRLLKSQNALTVCNIIPQGILSHAARARRHAAASIMAKDTRCISASNYGHILRGVTRAIQCNCVYPRRRLPLAPPGPPQPPRIEGR